MAKSLRPTSVTVIAVLQLVFGIGAVMSTVGGVAMLMVMPSKVTASQNVNGTVKTATFDANDEMEKEAPGFKAVLLGHSAFTLVVAGLMILGGASLLYLAAWSRWVNLLSAWLDILSTLAMVGYYLAVAIPAAGRVYSAWQAIGIDQLTFLALVNYVTQIGTPIGSVVFLVYPVLVIVLLSRAAAKRALAGLPPLDEPEDYHDGRREEVEEDDRGEEWRRRPVDDRFRE